MDINEFLGIAVVGVALSIVIQKLKDTFGCNSFEAKILTVTLSLVVGGAYYFLRQTVYWATVLAVLTTASTFYAFFLKE